MTDIQINKLLEVAQNLKSIFSEPLARKVLEIDVNAESSKQENLLSRLIRSIEQYVNKERDVVYVGFVGHYSSGKSSALNALLNLSNTNLQRETGLNPTDTAITLITHPQNANSLILMSREGSNVPVRTTLIENDLLSNLVIADTPGSGDPQIVNEMIQDFIPVCDIVMYFISAANPVDQADLPLLEQKTIKLPFIPVKYIITRTDEFRINRNENVSDQNLDLQKKAIFTGRLISRIKEIIKIQELRPDDFLFIDSEVNYNIPAFKTELIEKAQVMDVDELVRIHSYKLEYYNTNFNSIFQYFIKIIDEKIRQSTGYEKTASENISRFDKNAEINKEKLRLSWSRNEAKFKEDYNKELARLESLKITSLSADITYDKQIKSILIDIGNKIDNQSIGYAGNLIGNLNVFLKEKIRESKFSIFDNINKVDLLTDNLSHLFPARLSFQPEKTFVEIDFSKMNEGISALAQKIGETITGTKNIIRSQLNQLTGLVQEINLINSLKEQYDLGESSINDSFGQYFELIHMYRNTVLSRNNKDTIEKLRIGTQLDELDDDFSEEFISSMTDEAIFGIYLSSEKDVIQLQKVFGEHLMHINALKTSIDGISKTGIASTYFLNRENTDLSSLSEKLTISKEEKINKIYQDKLDAVLDNHKKKYDDYIFTKELKKQNRRKNVLKWTLLTGVLFLSVYFALKYLNYLTASSMTASISAGVVANLLGNLIGYIISSYKTDDKRISLKSQSEFIKNERTHLLQQFDENFWETMPVSGPDEFTNFTIEQIKKLYKNKTDIECNSIIEDNKVIYNDILQISKDVNILINQLREDITAFYNRYSLVFSDIGKNSEIISEITRRIRDVSIKPSFILLEETTKSLESVRIQIATIER